MDGLSLSANVAGLICLAIEVAKTLHSYIGAVKTAPQEANELHAEILALSQVLDTLVDTLRGDDIEEANFDQQSILYLVVGACEGHVRTVYKKLESFGATRKEETSWQDLHGRFKGRIVSKALKCCIDIRRHSMFFLRPSIGRF